MMTQSAMDMACSCPSPPPPLRAPLYPPPMMTQSAMDMACSCPSPPPPAGTLVPTSDDDTECYGHGLLLPIPPLRAPLYPPPMMTQSAMDMACSCPSPPPAGTLVPTSDDDTECYGHGLLLPLSPPPAGTLVPTSDDDTECYGHGLLLSPPLRAPLYPPPMMTQSAMDMACSCPSPPLRAPLYPPPMMTQSAMDMACSCPSPPPAGTLVPTSDDDTECYGHGLLLPPPLRALVPTSDDDTECYGHGLLLPLPPPAGTLVPTSDDDTECYGHGLLLSPPPLRAPLYPPPMMTQSAMDMACSCPSPPPAGTLVPTSDDDTECYGHGLLLPLPPPCGHPCTHLR